ncbi:hypothetical protein DSCA_49090 [Desulfosarcina alkanivorans]|uniref:Uncharacterized protein n=1 Tax=Desulfosarcina alkanivorans TaxID=571177 RepID=A0A5K7YSM8_9BACT|nr:hypothetical protein DSCA_49090 [Desulfosarcina alkanivorans]
MTRWIKGKENPRAALVNHISAHVLHTAGGEKLAFKERGQEQPRPPLRQGVMTRPQAPSSHWG